MSQPAIRVEGVWKEYVIGGHPAGARTFRETLTDTMTAPFRRATYAGANAAENRFWALKDVSLDIQPGEVVGIIGRNGAGKSTLLKILSRITAPTRGKVEIRGRIASLLEVGTGFHPELTGRENIRLNGAILGMTQAEIRAKFDEIVDFAGVEKFIDTPVKRYSSGMQVRLAFAVAAHLEPEILLVDEVLAVGDAEFQKKCLGKMGEIAGKGGRTVVFVSHNMAAVSALCQVAQYLDRGSLVRSGPAAAILKEYSLSGTSDAQFDCDPLPNSQLALSSAFAIYDEREGLGPGITLSMRLVAKEAITASVDVRVKDTFGMPVGFGSLGALNPHELIEFKRGINSLKLFFPAPRLAAGSYLLSIDLTSPWVAMYHRVEDCLALTVNPMGSEIGMRPLKQEWGHGSSLLPINVISLESIESGPGIA